MKQLILILAILAISSVSWGISNPLKHPSDIENADSLTVEGDASVSGDLITNTLQIVHADTSEDEFIVINPVTLVSDIAAYIYDTNVIYRPSGIWTGAIKGLSLNMSYWPSATNITQTKNILGSNIDITPQPFGADNDATVLPSIRFNSTHPAMKNQVSFAGFTGVDLTVDEMISYHTNGFKWDGALDGTASLLVTDFYGGKFEMDDTTDDSNSIIPVVTNSTGLWIGEHSAYAVNKYGIVLNSDGAGGDLVLGDGKDVQVYHHGTRAEAIVSEDSTLHTESLNNVGDFSANWDVVGDFAVDATDATYTHSGGTGTLTQIEADQLKTPGTENAMYAFTYTLSALTDDDGDMTASITTGYAVEAATMNLSKDGTFTVHFMSNTNPTDFVISATSGDAGDTFSLDNVTLKQVIGGSLVVNDSVYIRSGGNGCLMMRDTDDAGWTECFTLDGTMSCTTDADGICDGA